MLVYEKRRKESIKIVLPESFAKQSLLQSEQALGCDGTAITRAEAIT